MARGNAELTGEPHFVFYHPMLPADARMLITGATSGIGLEAAKQLARMHYSLVLHGRSELKVSAAAALVRDVAPRAIIETVVADLSSLEGVRGLAESLRSRYTQLHVLVNNAGLMVDTRQESADGHELTWAVNHLAAFVLTLELMPLLLAAEGARVVNVSSDLHKQAHLDLQDINLSRGKFNGVRAYANSKLMNVLFTYELARRLSQSLVTVNCLHPGFVATQFDRHLTGPFKLAWQIGLPFAIPPAEGAATTVHLASAPRIVNESGKYYVSKRSRPSSKSSNDTMLARQLWDLSEAVSGSKLVI
jgi:retinol dehydrogenase-12